jgi:hypothetical protein
MIKTSIIFGDKSKFAFEIVPIDEKQGFFRLCINNINIGSLKRKGEYIHAIFNIKKYFASKENLYEPIFENFTEEEFIKYMIPWNLANSKDPKDWEEGKRREIYVRFLGDQFDPISMFSLYKDGIITWLIYNIKDKKKRTTIYKLNAEDVEIVFNEFVKWYEGYPR